MRLGWKAPELQVTSWVFLRVLGLTSLVAFVSLEVQLDGLFGSKGIWPAQALATAADRGFSLLWLFPSSWTDRAAHGMGVVGGLASLLLVANVAPRVCLGLIWACYLSLVSAGSVFLHYQWDHLLIETAFTALFVAPSGLLPGLRQAPTHVGVWLVRLLLFKVEFLSGAAKLTHGDSAWTQLEALSFHFLTQPLPSTLAPWMHRLPLGVLQCAAAATLLIELLAPAGVLLGTGSGGLRRVRRASFWAILLLQLLITATGDHGFFGLLVITLALMALDDDFWRSFLQTARRWSTSAIGKPETPSAAIEDEPGASGVLPTSQHTAPKLDDRKLATRAALLAIAVGIVTIDGCQSVAMLAPSRLKYHQHFALESFSRYHTINRYASFPIVTKQRLEIELQASDDGATFRPYGFWYKPGRLSRPPAWAGFHLPRLDWQMWFAALAGDCRRVPWWPLFARALLEATPPVLELLESDPNHGHKPRFIRAILYDYRFTEPTGDGHGTPTAEEVGTWWTRRAVAVFCPTMSLTDSELVFVDSE